MQHKWVIDLKEYEKSKKKMKMRLEVDERIYYAGFSRERDMDMFEEELKDMKSTYESAIKELDEEVDIHLDCLVDSMEEFCEMYRERETLRGKLRVLNLKMETKKHGAI
jgi:hypothetical protein